MPDQKDTLDATRGDSFGWLAMMGGMPVFGARFIPIFRRIYNPGNTSWQNKIGTLMDDPRCCGTGACIINAAGDCWCGQKWDGSKMCHPNPHGMSQKDCAEKANETDGGLPRACDAQPTNS